MMKKIKNFVAKILVFAIVLGMFPTQSLKDVSAATKIAYKKILEPTAVYNDVYAVENYRAIVTNKDGKQGLIDLNGYEIIPCNNDQLTSVYEGKFYSYHADDYNKMGLYDCNGKQILKAEFSWIDVISDNCLVGVKNDKGRLYYASGKAISNTDYDSLFSIDKINIIASKNGKYGVLNTKGKQVVAFKYTDYCILYDAKKMLLKDTNNVWYLMNLNGTSASKIGKFDYVYSSDNYFTGCIHLAGNSVYYDYNYKGQQIGAPRIPNYAYNFYMINSTKRFINVDYNNVEIYDFNLKKLYSINDIYNASVSSGGLISVQTMSGENRVYDSNNKLILNMSGDFSNIYVVGDLIVKRNSYDAPWEVLNNKGELVKTYSDYININNTNGFLIAENKNGNYYLLDGKANVVSTIDTFYPTVNNIDNKYKVVYTPYQYFIFDLNYNLIYKGKNYDYAYALSDNNIFVRSTGESGFVISPKGNVLYTGIKSIELITNGNILVQNISGEWLLLNKNYKTIKKLGKYSWLSEHENLINAYVDNGTTSKRAIFDINGNLIVPLTEYEQICFDNLGKYVCVRKTNNSTTLYSLKNKSKLNLGTIKNVGMLYDGYIPYQAKNGKWGIYKLSGIGHDKHSTATTKSAKATFCSDGGKNLKKCKVCGLIISAKSKVYAASNVKLENKTYNGKTQKTKIVVKDKKGKVISSKNYKVSGTTKAKKVGVYKVKITFKSSSSKYKGSRIFYWSINPKGTNFTKISTSKNAISLTWSKQTKYTKGYEIEVSTKKDFSENNWFDRIYDNKTNSYTFNYLQSGKTYYVRIRTYNDKCKSEWSKVKSIKVK